jgi:hypothetical protein
MLFNPFQGIREPAACLTVMLENRFDASTMTRAVGVHTLQKAINTTQQRHHMQPTPEDLSVVSHWLRPLLEPEPKVPGKATESKPAEHSHASLPVAEAPQREEAVCHLRERGAVLLLFSLAKLKQARGWRELLEDATVANILQLLLERMQQLTSSMDPQVRRPPNS